MNVSGNYAPGTEYSPNAPWNEREQEQVEFPCYVKVVLFNNRVDVPTRDYLCEEIREEDYAGVEYDTRNVCWEDEYNENCLSIPTLLNELKEMAKKELPSAHGYRARNLREIIKACEGWDVDEVVVELN